MRILVLGGGAAGMLAAWRAASLGHAVTLLEANGRLGMKLRISGGGKCNLTHAGPLQDLLAAFRKEQARFLRPALHAFGNEDLLALLHREGVETYARENGRVFPLDRPGSAADVAAALEGLLRRAGVEVRFGARVTQLSGAAPRLNALLLEDGTHLLADRFILAVGGASYPETGTRGEILEALKGLGVPTQPWFPALAPVPLLRPHPEWEGVALRAGTLHLRSGPEGKRLAEYTGDVVFTKSGISGPAALELSREVEVARRAGAAWLDYALSVADEASLDSELRQLQSGNPHLAVRNWLLRCLPERLCLPTVISLGLPADQRLKDLPREARRHMVAMVRGFPLGAPGPVPLSRGEVAAGGVCLAAVDPHSMTVKGWENLRICGELLDIDGPVGGYNLQAAFSTGYVAGSMIS
jgi:predicted Rossmann fold flavoprotein